MQQDRFDDEDKWHCCYFHHWRGRKIATQWYSCQWFTLLPWFQLPLNSQDYSKNIFGVTKSAVGHQHAVHFVHLGFGYIDLHANCECSICFLWMEPIFWFGHCSLHLQHL